MEKCELHTICDLAKIKWPFPCGRSFLPFAVFAFVRSFCVDTAHCIRVAPTIVVKAFINVLAALLGSTSKFKAYSLKPMVSCETRWTVFTFESRAQIDAADARVTRLSQLTLKLIHLNGDMFVKLINRFSNLVDISTDSSIPCKPFRTFTARVVWRTIRVPALHTYIQQYGGVIVAYWHWIQRQKFCPKPGSEQVQPFYFAQKYLRQAYLQ